MVRLFPWRPTNSIGVWKLIGSWFEQIIYPCHMIWRLASNEASTNPQRWTRLTIPSLLFLNSRVMPMASGTRGANGIDKKALSTPIHLYFFCSAAKLANIKKYIKAEIKVRKSKNTNNTYPHIYVLLPLCKRKAIKKIIPTGLIWENTVQMSSMQ